MLDDLKTCLSRVDEEKLVFVHEAPDPTIVVSPHQIFDNDEPEKPAEETIEEKPQKQTKKAKTDWIAKLKKVNPKVWLAAAGAFILVVAIAIYFMLFGGNTQASVMPNLVGMTQEKAEKLLSDYGVTIDKTVYTELSDKYEEGKIIETDPKSGTSIKEGDVVKITVSKGKYIVLEDYVGMSEDEATELLESDEMGFKVNIKKEISSEKAGTVIDQSLKKGYKQDPTEEDRTITLTVSKGSYTVLGNYVGMTYDEAKAKLEAIGFTVSKSEQSSDKQSGTVIEQSLASGYKVDPDESDRHITLTVSIGNDVEVPNVIGKKVEDAQAYLESAGFIVNPEAGEKKEGEQGIVYKQTPEGGSSVKKGATITIYYYDE